MPPKLLAHPWRCSGFLLDLHVPPHLREYELDGGDGLEWVAVMPFGFVFFCFVGPALVMSSDGRWLKVAAALVTISLVFNAILFLEVASELTGEGARTLHL